MYGQVSILLIDTDIYVLLFYFLKVIKNENPSALNGNTTMNDILMTFPGVIKRRKTDLKKCILRIVSMKLTNIIYVTILFRVYILNIHYTVKMPFNQVLFLYIISLLALLYV